MELSKSGHSIKSRQKANDIFYTPINAVNKHLSLIKHNENDKWLDPFYGQGVYYDAFPTLNKDWCEIEKQRDFFEYTDKVDIICSNPPYSIIDKVLEHSVKLQPRIISYLIGQGNLTTKRIEYMNKQGYGLSQIHFMKIWRWYGMSYIVVFEKNKDNVISYDRTVYR